MNAYPVIIKNIPSTLVTIRAVVCAGSSSEVIPGTAHYLEHMMFKGTKNHNYQEMNQRIEELGSVNAYTAEDTTVYYINTTKENTSAVFDILCEMMFEPLFDNDELNKERTVILEEAKARLDNPQCMFFDKLNGDIFGDIGHSGIGSFEDIGNIDREHVVNFYDKFYRPGNMVFAVLGDVGNFNENEANAIMSKYVSDSDSESFNCLPTIDFDFKNRKNIETKFKMKQSYLCLTLPTIPIKESFNNYFVEDIAHIMLGGGLSSLLFQRIREEKGLCYSIGMGQSAIWDNTHSYIFTMLDKKNLQVAYNEINNVIKQVQDGDFSDKMIDIARNNAIFHAACQQETLNGQANKIANEYFIRKVTGDNPTFNEYRERILSCPNMKERIQNYAKMLVGGHVSTMNGKIKI